MIAESSGMALKVLIYREIAGPLTSPNNRTHSPRVRSIARGMNDILIREFELMPSSFIESRGASLT